MEIREINDKKIWEGFILQCARKTFLQSCNWGDFNLKMGNSIWRLGIYDKEKLIGVALAIKTTAKRGVFLLVPHGPVIIKHSVENIKQALETLLNKLKEIGKEEKADFIRINPILERAPENEKIFSNLGFRQAPMQSHPEASWKLDISAPEEQILSQMRKTTRYLIKQAQKDPDIKIIKSADINDINLFNKLHLEVVKVQKFIPFSLNYFNKEFESFSKDNQILILFAKYKDEFAAASYVLFWSGVGFYHHAALLPECHKVPLAYLLQWEAIKEAKKRGCATYDFWGYADPKTQPNHPWSGPTLFKMGFGGYKDEYVKTQDYVLSSKYWLNYIIERIRKIKRGL